MEDRPAHGQEQHQNVCEEELGRGDRRQRDEVDGAVEDAVAIERCQKAQHQGQRDGDERRHARQDQGVDEPRGDQVGDVAAVPAEAARARVGLAEIALHHAADPLEVALDRRAIEPDLALERRYRLGRCRLAEHRLGEVAGQKRHGEGDDDRDDEQGDRAEPEALQHCLDDRVHELTGRRPERRRTGRRRSRQRPTRTTSARRSSGRRLPSSVRSRRARAPSNGPRRCC